MGSAAAPAPPRARVRAFVPADYASARRLWERTEGMGLNEADGEDSVRRYLERNPGLSAVATTDDGEVVGAVLCGHDGRRGFLDHLAVSPPHRGRGLARSLVEHCFAGLARAGIPRCNVFVYEDNRGGLEFFRHDGWYDATWKTLQKRLPAAPER